MEEKPLHVKVATALGCRVALEGGTYFCRCPKRQHSSYRDDGGPINHDAVTISGYDTDWSATGPLLEQYGLSVFRPDEFNPDREDGPWLAGAGGVHGWDDSSVLTDYQSVGKTPLLAVCHLILTLHAAGKLER